MNPAPSNPSLLSRLLLAKPAVVLSLALFGLSLPVAKAEKLRIGISMKTLNAPQSCSRLDSADKQREDSQSPIADSQ
jgi:hypothetical protein